MDETYIKGKGEWRYLYRAVDKQGQTIDFLLTEHRDTEAALRFLKKAIRRRSGATFRRRLERAALENGGRRQGVAS